MSASEPPGAINYSSPQSNASEPSAPSYAFLVHSQKTLTQNLPPRVDNKLLARQKRRRTSNTVHGLFTDNGSIPPSPEDHAVLEAEYQRNPKPDKEARASIVSRVALGEKEVQIWFQNRRQNDRRKSKPLQPHEFTDLRTTIGDSSQQNRDGGNTSGEPHDADIHETNAIGDDTTVSPCGDETGESSFERRTTPEHVRVGEKDMHSSQSGIASESPQWNQCEPDSAGRIKSKHHQHTQSRKEPCPYSMKRKRSLSDIHGRKPEPQCNRGMIDEQEVMGVDSPPSLRISLSFDGEAMVRKEWELTPRKARSTVRISMSADGEALIRTEDEPSPSQNHRTRLFPAGARRLLGLRRSNSAVLPGVARESGSKPFGRSRDSRTWELYCDPDARSALSPGSSSQGPTSTSIRPRNQRSSTLNSLGKQRMTTARTDFSDKMLGSRKMGEKRKLCRTVSSFGRLETGQSIAADKKVRLPIKQISCALERGKYDTEDAELQLGDSDKENWIPGTQISNAHRWTSRMRARYPALGEAGARRSSDKNLEQTTSCDLIKLSDGSGSHVNVNRKILPPGLDEKASALLSASGQSSRDEDLDCVQGLLSLSQGAWR